MAELDPWAFEPDQHRPSVQPALRPIENSACLSLPAGCRNAGLRGMLRSLVVRLAAESQCHLAFVPARRCRLVSCLGEEFVFPIDVGLDDLRIVQRERKCVEHLGRPQLGIALQDSLDLGAIAKERKHPSNGDARAIDERTTPEHGWFDSDMGMRD